MNTLTLNEKEKNATNTGHQGNSGFICVQKLNRRHTQICNPENYQILWLESGVKSMITEFEKVKSLPYSITFIHPGKEVNLQFNCLRPRGWILRLPLGFFNLHYFGDLHIQYADLMLYSGETPSIVLSPKIGERINSLTEMIAEVMQSNLPNREIAALSLVKTLLVYCDSSCNIPVKASSNNHYLSIVSKFKHLVSQKLNIYHRVTDYALLMHLSPRYLNNVVKEVMGVNAKSIISEQLIFKSCRDLKFTNLSIKEIAIQLGFSEPEHFSNFFKKKMGCSPMTYRQK